MLKIINTFLLNRVIESKRLILWMSHTLKLNAYVNLTRTHRLKRKVYTDIAICNPQTFLCEKSLASIRKIGTVIKIWWFR